MREEIERSHAPMAKLIRWTFLVSFRAAEMMLVAGTFVWLAKVTDHPLLATMAWLLSGMLPVWLFVQILDYLPDDMMRPIADRRWAFAATLVSAALCMLVVQRVLSDAVDALAAKLS